MNQLRTKSLHAFKWNVVDAVATQVINFAFNLWMLRLLSPDDFGLFAIPFLIYSLIRLTQDFEHSALIVQNEENDTGFLNEVFTLLIFVGLIISLSCYLLAPILQWFFPEPRAVVIMRLMAIIPFISSFYFVSEALLRRALDFKKIFFINILATLGSGFIGIAYAYYYPSPLALVIKYSSYIIILSIASYVYSSYKPSWKWRPSVIFDHLSFTLPLFKNQILTYAAKNIDSLLVGKFMGTSALGIYDRSYRFLLFPVSQVSSSFTKVMLPSIARIKDDIIKSREAYLLVSRMIAIIVFPMMIGLVLLADPFVKVIIGVQWIAMIPILRLFAFISIAFSLTSISQSVYIAQGKTKELFSLHLMTNSILIIALCITIVLSRNLWLTAFVFSVISSINTVIIWYATADLLSIKIIRIVNNVTPVILATLAMAVIIFVIRQLPFLNNNDVQCLMICSIIGAISYWLVLILFKIKAYEEFKILIKELGIFGMKQVDIEKEE